LIPASSTTQKHARQLLFEPESLREIPFAEPIRRPPHSTENSEKPLVIASNTNHKMLAKIILSLAFC
jgi:hypothetical protein